MVGEAKTDDRIITTRLLYPLRNRCMANSPR